MKIFEARKSMIILVFSAVIVSFMNVATATATVEGPGAPTVSTFATAEAAFKRGDYSLVTDILWKNIETLDRKGLILLAIAHEKKNEAANMLKVATLLTSKNPKDYEAHYLLGSAQLMSKKTTEALDSLKESLEINPKYLPAYEKLAQMYEQKKNTYELRILYQDMVEKIGKRSEFLNKLCEINTATDYQEDQARRYCKDAIAKDPKVADNYVYMGIVQKNAGELEESKKTLRSAADAHSKSEFAQYSYANLLEEQKNYLDAAKYFLACTVADPASARCWVGYAKSTFEIHKYEQALDAYKKACKLDRKNAATFRKATTLLRNSKDSKWIKLYESASEGCSGY